MRKGKRRVVVAFGDISLETDAPTRAHTRKNILAGQKALARALPKLLSAGVHLDPRPGVPIFYADDDDPEITIREIDGVCQSGKLVNGQFVPEC